MSTASLKLCKELYDLSGWGSGTLLKDQGDIVNRWHQSWVEEEIEMVSPAYDLGYLLRKLPGKIKRERLRLEPRLQWVDDAKWWVAHYVDGSLVRFNVTDESPEDALCKLAIELFKHGELTKS